MIETRPCPLCGSNGPIPIFRPRRSPGPVSKCPKCGMVYVSSIQERKTIIFDGPVVDDLRDPAILTSSKLDDVTGCWEYRLLPQKEAEWPALRANAADALVRIESLLPEKEAVRSILDFGSGWGFFLAAAQERGWETCGLEPLAVSATYARAKFGLNVTTDTLRDDTFPENRFTAITSFQVFEHLPGPRVDLQRLSRMLAPGGVVLVEVPAFDTGSVALLRSHHRHFTQDHINFFSTRTLKRLFESCGLEVAAVYRPSRRISVRYLLSYWGSRLLPRSGEKALSALARTFHVWETILAIQTGDVIAVIGRKPGSGQTP
jgi:cyclopropane fatty-acyl-phospholipid synthase-like methyltransferase